MPDDYEYYDEGKMVWHLLFTWWNKCILVYLVRNKSGHAMHHQPYFRWDSAHVFPVSFVLLCLQDLTVSVRFFSQQGLYQRSCHTTQDLYTIYWPNTGKCIFWHSPLVSNALKHPSSSLWLYSRVVFTDAILHTPWLPYCHKSLLVPVLAAKQSVWSAWNVIYKCQ